MPDNDAFEYSFQFLSHKRIRQRTLATRNTARQDVYEYTEMSYNLKQRQARSWMPSPIGFERQRKTNEAGVRERWDSSLRRVGDMSTDEKLSGGFNRSAQRLG